MIRFEDDIQPELDTIRIFYFCQKVVDIRAFMCGNASDVIRSVQRNDEGEFVCRWEKIRLDHKCSWCKTMQIGQGVVKFGRGQDTHEEGLFFEYSVAKWYNTTNGLNSLVPATKVDYLAPILETLKRINILDYSKYEDWGDFEKHFRCHYMIRRLDLSFNFMLPGDIHTSDAIKVLSNIRMNNNDTEIYPDVMGKYSSVSWGGGRGSNYKMIFYDKQLEQKHYYQYYVNSHFISDDIRDEMKTFYRNNFHLFENIIRFEIQFKSKFFLANFKSDYKFRRGETMAAKIITFSKKRWLEKLEAIDNQLGTLNNCSSAGDFDSPFEQALARLENLREEREISNAVCSNLRMFMMDCNQKGWKNVRRLYSQQSFSKKYNDLKKFTNFDVKLECLENIPIIYIMSKNVTYLEKVKNQIYFRPGNSVNLITKSKVG